MAEQPTNEIMQFLAGQKEAMVALLAELVNIDSGSYNKAGVDAVGARLRQHLESEGILCETIPNDTYGDCLRAAVPGGPGNGQILLMGHRDTVFPDGTAAARPFRIEGDRATGPGVADMKAGLVMNSFVLAAFKRFGGAPCPLVGLYTADEEIASPSSRPIIEAEARRSRAVFNAEPGRPSGNVVTQRKGAAFIRFEVTGKATHSGVDHRGGISAIEALCRKVQRLHALTDYEAGTTVNVGLVKGGTAVNTVAAEATGEVDIRYQSLAIMEEVLARVQRICTAEELPGSRGRILHEGRFLPLTPSAASKELLDLYASSASDLGFAVAGEATGGSADSGFTAACGATTLCGTGPVGGNPHRDDEWCRLDTIVPRAQALALTILKMNG
ncbi:MAG TPA: M20 family metallopeptidase [Stellaceae bacterium]|nr:M20 family metallopeptidase [Stellaceae bacterium]